MVAVSNDELRTYFVDHLSPAQMKTIDWWIETDQSDTTNPLVEIAKLYRKAYRRSLPGPGGKTPPSHLGRELKEIEKAFARLNKVLTIDLSKEAKEFLKSSGDHFVIKPWLSDPWLIYTTASLDSGSHVRPGERLDELTRVISYLQSLPKPRKRVPPHSFLIRWTATRLRLGGKPRSHVLPIARAMHHWASRERVSSDWGEEYLKVEWPPRQ